jgi:CxxC motif-containing protein (DUF1111 family)
MDLRSRINPYQIAAGGELDKLVHQEVMGETGTTCPAYSADEKASRRVLAKLKATSTGTFVVGQTSLRKKTWFARYETDASDGTEVLAETLPLAICRLALLRIIHKSAN